MVSSVMHDDGSVTFALRVDAVVTDEHLPPMGLGALLRQPQRAAAEREFRLARKKKPRQKPPNFMAPCARDIDDPIKRIVAVLEHEGVTFANHLCTRAGVDRDDLLVARTERVIIKTWKKYATGGGALAYCLQNQVNEQQREMFTC